MQATVKVFTVVPGAAPQPAAPLVVEAKTHDGLREAARAALAAQGHRIRALSFTATGLVAYVETPA
jgi:hypothetical protein